MRKILFFLSAVFLILFIYGCEQIVCEPPYLQVGTSCCLDKDSNKVCDNDEVFAKEPEIVVKTDKVPVKEVTKYVCSDGSVTDTPAKCEVQECECNCEDVGLIGDPLLEESYDLAIPDLNKTSETNSAIQQIILEPSCPNGIRGGRIFFKVGSVPSEIKIQIKEIGVDEEFRDVFTRTGIYEQYQYFAICDSCRGGGQINFKLKPGKAYIFRMVFDQTKIFNRLEYSNEYLIDTRSKSEYLLHLCS